jgi:uncharacterized damage-inducible protein DinB
MEEFMFQTIADLASAWEKESTTTQKLIDVLSDASLSQPIVEGHRTLGRITWHIVTTIPEMMERMGVSIKSVAPDDPIPGEAALIRHSYASAAGELLEQIKTQWSDKTLLIEDDMYGEKWPRGLSVRALIDHQTHHRGQMTVLMRQAGLRVPGICGPSLEEWERFGIPPPEI